MLRRSKTMHARLARHSRESPFRSCLYVVLIEPPGETAVSGSRPQAHDEIRFDPAVRRFCNTGDQR
jgi:hypothetical protein